MKLIKKDFIIVGSGLAGLSAAYFAGKKGTVALITKGTELKSSKSFNSNDGVLFSQNLDILYSDILKTHYQNKNEEIVKKTEEKIEFFIENVNSIFYFLKEDLGINFNGKGEKLFGHSEENIFFSSERTEKEICEKLIKEIEKNDNIEIFLDTKITGFISKKIETRFARKDNIGGSHVLGVSGTLEGTPMEFLGKNILSTIGTGEGIYNFNHLGESVKLLKSVFTGFVHMGNIAWTPLCLDFDWVKNSFLPLEILNYGAFLINSKGEKFLGKYLNEGENLFLSDLSTICFEEGKKTGSGDILGKIFLDMRHKSKSFWQDRFPELYKILENGGIDTDFDVISLKNIQNSLIGGGEISINTETKTRGLHLSGELSYLGVLGEKWMPGIKIPKSIILGRQFANNSIL